MHASHTGRSLRDDAAHAARRAVAIWCGRVLQFGRHHVAARGDPAVSAQRAVVALIAIGWLLGTIRCDAGATNSAAAELSVSEVIATVLSPYDGALESYSVPIHIAARIHKLISVRFAFDGVEFVRRPDEVVLDVRAIPERFRRLFGELGVPLTWDKQYDLTVADVVGSGRAERYLMHGIPKKRGEVDYALFTVGPDPSDPIRARWFCRDGTTIDMTIHQGTVGHYALPKHADEIVHGGGFTIAVTMDYDSYALNGFAFDAVRMIAGSRRKGVALRALAAFPTTHSGMTPSRLRRVLD